MYTIKQASRLTGVSEATLRAWERRYDAVIPHRNASGYRIYDKEAVAAILAMRRLIDAGWAPAEAARAVRDGAVPTTPAPAEADVRAEPAVPRLTGAAQDATEAFLRAAASLDPAAIEQSLDRGFATGSFEHVVEHWLMPTLIALGDGWADGAIDVAGEHMASQAVHRRLAAAFDAAGSRSRGPSVVVGLPPGSLHELGALAFATAAKRRGLNVLYMGPDLPASSWVTAVETHGADAAVLAVVSPHDRPAAVETARRLLDDQSRRLLVAAGGSSGRALGAGVHTLPTGIDAAAEELDDLLHSDDRRL